MTKYSENGKRIAKNTFYLYIRMIVSLVISLYTSRVFLEALGVEDYGIYNIVGGFVALLAILTNTIRSAAQRFITYALGEGDFEKLKNTFSTFKTLYLLIGVAIFSIGEIFGFLFLEKLLVLPINRLDAAYFVFHCSLLIFVIHLVTIPFHASVIAHEKMNFFAIVSIVESLLKLLIAYLLFVSPFDTLKTYGFLLCVVCFFVLFVNYLYCRLKFLETGGSLRIHYSIFKEVLSYSTWVIIGSSSSIVKEQGVNIVINNFWGVAINAAKGVSMQVEHAVNMFSSNIGTAISPQITKSYASGDTERAIRLTFMMAKVQGVLLLFLCIPLITEADFVLSLWLKDVPDHAVLFTKWVLVLCIARTLDASVVPLHLAIGKQKYIQLVCGGTMLLNLPLSYFVLFMGADPVSTVIVGIVIEFIVLFFVTLFLKRYVDFPIWSFFLHSVFSVAVVGFVTLLLLDLIISVLSQGVVRFLIVGLLSSLMVSVTAYYLTLNTNEREIIKGFVIKKIKNIRHQ